MQLLFFMKRIFLLFLLFLLKEKEKEKKEKEKKEGEMELLSIPFIILGCCFLRR